MVITASLLAIFSGHLASIPELHFFYIGGIAEVIIMIGIAAVSLLTAPPDYDKIAPYVWRPQLLRAYDEGVRRPWYQQLKLVVRHRDRHLAGHILVVLVNANTTISVNLRSIGTRRTFPWNIQTKRWNLKPVTSGCGPGSLSSGATPVRS